MKIIQTKFPLKQRNRHERLFVKKMFIRDKGEGMGRNRWIVITLEFLQPTEWWEKSWFLKRVDGKFEENHSTFPLFCLSQ